MHVMQNVMCIIQITVHRMLTSVKMFDSHFGISLLRIFPKAVLNVNRFGIFILVISCTNNASNWITLFAFQLFVLRLSVFHPLFLVFSSKFYRFNFIIHWLEVLHYALLKQNCLKIQTLNLFEQPKKAAI